MNKNKEWKEDFRHKWEGANGTLCSVTIESMLEDISTYVSQAEDNMRKRCVEAVEKLKKDPNKEATRCSELSLDYLSASGEALQFFGWNSAIDQATQNINNLDKRK